MNDRHLTLRALEMARQWNSNTEPADTDADTDARTWHEHGHGHEAGQDMVDKDWLPS